MIIQHQAMHRPSNSVDVSSLQRIPLHEILTRGCLKGYTSVTEQIKIVN